MPETDKILAELNASFTGVAEAGARIANALAHAHDVQARMAVAGFAGIAIGMSDVVDVLEQIRARLRAAADGLRTTTGTVQEISATMQLVPEELHEAGRRPRM